MRQKNAEKEPGDAMAASVRTEMAKPRMARSARIAELNLDTARTNRRVPLDKTFLAPVRQRPHRRLLR